MTKTGRQRLLQYLVSVLSVAIALAMSYFIPALRQRGTLFIFLAAVMVSTWYGGWGPAMVAVLLSGIATAKFIIPPEDSVLITNPSELMRWTMFVLVAVLISSLHASRGEAEKLLRRSEQRLMLALDSARMGAWDYNMLTGDFWWSKSLETIYGRPSAGFPKTYGHFFGTLHIDDQPLFNRAITRTIDEGTDYEIEHRILLPDGRVRWINTRGRVFFNENAKAERIVGVAMDITNNKVGDKAETRPVIEPMTERAAAGVGSMA